MFQKLKTACLLLSVFFTIALHSQSGLEQVIVEKFYVSGAGDTVNTAVFGKLPLHSVTYRIYLDLKPGYRFYAAYGKPNQPLTFSTTTVFFNSERNGNKIPNIIPRRSISKGTVLLDSWFSAGAVAEDYYGILKSDDTSSIFIDPTNTYLKNKSKDAPKGLTKQDGMVEAFNLPYPVLFGIDSAANVFFNSNKSGVFTCNNGAWGCLGGAVGYDSLGTNRVLIAQMTTDGEFSFSLNVQIGEKGQAPELLVAKNAGKNDILFPALNYNSAQSSGKGKPKADKSLTSNKTKKH